MAGAVVNLDSMAFANVAVNNISDFAIRPQDFKHAQGKIIRFPMSSGEPLLSHFLAAELHRGLIVGPLDKSGTAVGVANSTSGC